MKVFDIIITLAHGLFRKENEDKDLFEVRTRKILLISNSIASTSTIINTAITRNPKNLDIGSLLNTITHLFTDVILRNISRVRLSWMLSSSIMRMCKPEIECSGYLFSSDGFSLTYDGSGIITLNRLPWPGELSTLISPF